MVIEQSCVKKLDFFLDFADLEKRDVKRGVIILSRTVSTIFNKLGP
jgi:hypothetical protein